MTGSRRRRGSGRRAARAALSMLLTLMVVLGSQAAGLAASPPARATGALPSDPAVQAAQLAAQVAALQAAAERASEGYDAAEGRLGAAVTAHLLVGRQLAATQARDQALAGAVGAGVRAVYESGGPLALYASLLAPGGLSGLSDRAAAVSRLVQGEEFTSRAGRAADRRLALLDAELAASATLRTRLASQAAGSALVIESDLATQRRLLAAADDQVRAQAALDAAAALGRDQAAFRAALAAAVPPASVPPAALATGGGSGGPGTGTGNSPLTRAAIAAITTRLGTPYQWGGTGPVSYDCSGLTGYAYEAAGVSMPRTAAQQYLTGQHVPLADLQPGDLLFWGSSAASIDHVAMYAGGGLMFSDDHTGDVARLQPVWLSDYLGATRVNPAMAAAVAGPQWVAGR